LKAHEGIFGGGIQEKGVRGAQSKRSIKRKNSRKEEARHKGKRGPPFGVMRANKLKTNQRLGLAIRDERVDARDSHSSSTASVTSSFRTRKF